MPIDIRDKKDCTGCNSCVQRCPKQCIAMHPDDQGFIYPKVDLSLCIDCGLCERVCPVINRGDECRSSAACAAKNTQSDIERASSSGGVFTAIATYMIRQGGIVFGARFNEEWQVCHGWTDTLEGLEAFRTSKYLQSEIGDSFVKVREFLSQGKSVMFTGTPCQIAGLRLFLGKDYGSRLLLVDFICHGVPSPGIWKEYLQNLKQTDRIGIIKSISFRDKKISWERFGLSITSDKGTFFEPHYENLYMQGFLKDLNLRPSCFACPAKAGRSGSDLTLADFWGIQKEYPELYREGKYSLVLVRSEKGRKAIVQLKDISSTAIETETAVRHNPALVRSAHEPKIYREFWKRYSTEGLSAIEWGVRKLKPSLARRILRKGKQIVRKITRK